MVYFFVQGCDGSKYNINSLNFDHYYWHVFNPQKLLLAVLFGILCPAFLAISVNLVLTLRLRAPKLYAEFKTILWCACFILSIPLSFRAILDFLYQYNAKFQAYFTATDHRELSYNIAFTMLTSYIPILF